VDALHEAGANVIAAARALPADRSTELAMSPLISPVPKIVQKSPMLF
jgi:hypothetical protein